MRKLLLLCLVAMPTQAAMLDVWIGTTAGPDDPARGIYHLTLDDQTGKLSPATLAAETTQPGFLAKHPTLRVLYSTVDAAGGAVAAWTIVEEGDGKRLEPLGEPVPTGDGGPCFVSVDHTGRVLLSAQYGGGSVASYRLNEDGSIAGRATLLEHDDPSGVDPDRQSECHAHWAGVSPDNRFVLAPDLGADRVYVHRLDTATGELARHGSAKTNPGGGPRHFAFHPNGELGFLVNEMALTLSTLRWDAATGALTMAGDAKTLSEDQKAHERHNSGSEVRVHPSGRFVYSANRGHDSISVFRIDESTGALTLVEQEPVRGAWPRNFNLDPSGRWLLAAGKFSHTLAVFEIDPQTGALEYTLEIAGVPSPICVLFVR